MKVKFNKTVLNYKCWIDIPLSNFIKFRANVNEITGCK